LTEFETAGATLGALLDALLGALLDAPLVEGGVDAEAEMGVGTDDAVDVTTSAVAEL
jgi:hypothetical protein